MKALRLLTVMIAVSALAVVPALAQTTPPAQPPAKPPATPPATAQPATPPPAVPAAPPQAPRPYPEGAKIAYIDIQAVASNSVEGKAATGKLQELEKKKVGEITEKNKQLEAAKTKQQTSSTIMNDSARLSLEKEVDKLTREVQFLQQEAQSERQSAPGRAPGRLSAQAESRARADRQGTRPAHARRHQQRWRSLGRHRPRPDWRSDQAARRRTAGRDRASQEVGTNGSGFKVQGSRFSVYRFREP